MRGVVLGIVDGLHDAGAALVVDGALVSAANEERFTRRKLQGGVPRESIRAVLARAGVSPKEVDVVAVAGRATPTAATRVCRPLQTLYGPSLGICFDRPWHPVDLAGDLFRYRLHLTRLKGEGRGGRLEGRVAAIALGRSLPPRLRDRPLRFVDHHLAHAESAWRTSGGGRWLVVTADAHGDGRSLTVWEGREDAGLRLRHEIGVAESLGAFYSLVTRALGFVPGRHEGKVLGLAARGSAANVPLEWPFSWAGEALRYRGAWGLKGSRWLRRLHGVAREDVAAWVQAGTERTLLEGVRRWIAETGATQIALAGGVFANVRVNGRIAAEPGVERLHVFPHMGDGGLAVGAALHVAGAAPHALGPVTDLGPRLGDGACAEAARAGGFPVHRPAEADLLLLDRLLLGEPVVRCVGSMEYGPRALGHRSVLAPAGDPAVTDRLNQALGRDDFMPFAPVLAVEEGEAAFEHVGVADRAARTMTVALPVRPAFRRTCPAAVHVDDTARPQLLDAAEDPGLYDLLRRHHERTGRPAVINTSFNLHEEPIVNTPHDAVRAFAASGLPWLRLGPLVLENPASVWRRSGGPARG